MIAMERQAILNTFLLYVRKIYGKEIENKCRNIIGNQLQWDNSAVLEQAVSSIGVKVDSDICEKCI